MCFRLFSFSPWPPRRSPARVTGITTTLSIITIIDPTLTRSAPSPGPFSWPDLVLRESHTPDRKRLAHKCRALQPVSPGQLRRLGDADPDPADHIDFAHARMQGKWRLVQRQFAVPDGDAERLAQFAGTRAQGARFRHAAAAAHHGETMGGLQRADQHRAGGAFGFADEIHAPMNAVGAVDVAKARRPEHGQIARRR